MVTVLDIRPVEIPLRFRPGDSIKVVFNFSPAGSLAGKAFTATLGAASLGVAIAGDSMTVTATAVQTTGLAAKQDFALRETTTGANWFIGDWVPSNQGSTQQTTTITAVVGTATVTVTATVSSAAALELLRHQAGVSELRYRMAIARAGNPSANLFLIADSVARFGGAKFRNTWPDRLRRLLQRNTPGTMGFLPASENLGSILDVDWPGGDNPWTFTGSCSANIEFGVGFHSANIPSGGGSASITYFGDKINLFYVRNTTGPTAATVTLDGVSVGPLNANGSLLPGRFATYGTHGNYGFHTLVVTPNSGTLIIEGVQWFDGDAPFFVMGNVQMVDGSHAGFPSTAWSGVNNDWSTVLNSWFASGGQCIIELGANDFTLSNTPQQLEDALVTIAARVDARMNFVNEVSFILLIMPGGFPLPQDYINAFYKAADRIGAYKCRVVDLAAFRPDRVFGSDLSSDGAHPNDNGHVWVYEQLAQFLDLVPGTQGPPVTPTHQIIEASEVPTFRSSWAESWVGLQGSVGGYDESPGSGVCDKIYRRWHDAGTYRVTATFEHATARGTAEVQLGRWNNNTPALVSLGTINTNTPAGPTPVTTRFATTVVNDVPGWVPLYLRRTTATSGTIRPIQLDVDKIA